MIKIKFFLFFILALISVNTIIAQEEDNNTNPELLKNEFFHEVEGNLPKYWELRGNGVRSEVFQGHGVFRNSGYALRVHTGGEKAILSQTIELNSTITLGAELEGLIHYSVEKFDETQGAVRLAMKWLDASGNEIAEHKDKDFVDNEELYFSHFKSYGTLWFRISKPEKAVKVKFAIEIKENAVVKFDDFSLKLQNNNEPFIAVLPQTLREFRANVGETSTQKVFVQMRNLGADVKVTLPTGQPFEVDKSTLSKGNKVEAINLVFKPTSPTKIPRGYASAPSVSIGVDGLTKRVNLNAAAIDKNNPPKVMVAPASFETIKLSVGETITKEITVNAPNAIDNVNISLEPKGKGFISSTSSLYYFTKATNGRTVGINETKIRITFTAKEEGVVDGKLIFTSSMMDDFEYPIRAEVIKSTSIQENFSKEKTITDKRYPNWTEGTYHNFDMGLWKYSDKTKAEYYADIQSVVMVKDNTHLRFVGSFIPGLIYNSDFPNGIKKISVYYANASENSILALEKSINGGATWEKISEVQASKTGNGVANYEVNTNKPTLFRIVLLAKEGTSKEQVYTYLEKVKITAADEEGREKSVDIKDYIDTSKQGAMAQMFYQFNDIPHHLNFVSDGWFNIALNTNRTAVSFDERVGDINSEVVETAVKMTLYKANKYDPNKEMSIVLASPLLSYSDAQTKELGFRLKRTIENENTSFDIAIAKITDGKIANEADIITIPYEKMLPNEKMTDNFWFDYLLDLSKYDLGNIDKFVILFQYKTSNEGDNSSTSYYIDDFSWGKANNPTIKVDKKALNFYEITDAESEPQSIVVSTENATSYTVAKLFGHLESFKLKDAKNKVISDDRGEAKLKNSGETLNITIKTRATRDISSLLYLATRGGTPVTVRLFATRKTKKEIDDANNNGNNNGNGNNNNDGYDNGDDTIGGGDTAVDDVTQYDSYAYRQGNSIVVVSENMESVELYNLDGTLLNKKKATNEISFDGVPESILILRITLKGGKHIVFKL